MPSSGHDVTVAYGHTAALVTCTRSSQLKTSMEGEGAPGAMALAEELVTVECLGGGGHFPLGLRPLVGSPCPSE